jgi:hypothetical protein
VDLRAVPPELSAIVAAAACLLALVQTLRLAWRRAWGRRTLALRREQGAAGEARAEALLRALGYRILGRQVAVAYDVEVDGEPIGVDLRADYLVALDGRRFVAEVKTGRAAPRIETSATRRQLLEYRVAFDVDGVLLVDADAARVHAVVFPLELDAHPAPRPSRLAWLLVGVLLGLGVAAARAGW